MVDPTKIPMSNVIHWNLWLRHLTFHPKKTIWLQQVGFLKGGKCWSREGGGRSQCIGLVLIEAGGCQNGAIIRNFRFGSMRGKVSVDTRDMKMKKKC